MDVLMPQLGETVAEGKITKWFKAPGDTVVPGENLFEIETDKVSMEVPAIMGGVLAEIRVPAGEIVPVGAVVAVVSGGAAELGAQTITQSPLIPAKAGIRRSEPMGPRLGGDERAKEPSVPFPAFAAAPTPKLSAPLDPFHEVRTPERNFGPARLPGGAMTTPLARRLAGESGIDIGRINGSGPHGRIIARDVQAALSRRPAGPAPLAQEPTTEQVKALYTGVAYEEIPLDAMRRTIAARLTQAVRTIPHFHLTADIDLDRLNEVREEANAAASRTDDTTSRKLSLNDFFIKALALALQRVPAANAVWAEDRILRFKPSDVGVAVALEGGLITPIIRNAEGKSIGAISTEMRDLAARARSKKLRPDEYQGGATAISNLGMYGIREFSAIINPPHATILAVGAVQRRPVEAEDGRARFVSQMTATLSCDHRVVDGALGAELLAAFKGFIERPVTMLV
jgi:pyruvate dehydrogenase E2 component (dihydrolipoamide acetyltransferase)